MAECAFCRAETELFNGFVPVCVKCADTPQGKRKPPTAERQVLNVLHQDLQAATERAKAATASFEAVTSQTPSVQTHPNGTQRIHKASREISRARVRLMIAHNRLNDYLSRGIVPDDLKQGTGS